MTEGIDTFLQTCFENLIVNVLAFHLKTVPDLDAGRRFWNLGDLGDVEVGAVMHSKRRQETGGKSDSVRHYFQKVVSISAVHKIGADLKIWSFGEEEGDSSEVRGTTERLLLQEFYSYLGSHSPELVSWCGTSFDMPVLHYRALANEVSAASYWNIESQYVMANNGLSQGDMTCRHTDLMNALGGIDNVPSLQLAEVASLLGFPSTPDMTSKDVFEAYLSGNIGSIRNNTDIAVLKVWCIYLRFQYMSGHMDLDIEIEQTRNCLASGNQPDLSELLVLWDAMASF